MKSHVPSIAVAIAALSFSTSCGDNDHVNNVVLSIELCAQNDRDLIDIKNNLNLIANRRSMNYIDRSAAVSEELKIIDDDLVDRGVFEDVFSRKPAAHYQVGIYNKHTRVVLTNLGLGKNQYAVFVVRRDEKSYDKTIEEDVVGFVEIYKHRIVNSPVIKNSDYCIQDS